MIPINNVRNVVMFLLNKNNYGYISPEEFNTYCNLAQLDMFIAKVISSGISENTTSVFTYFNI